MTEIQKSKENQEGCKLAKNETCVHFAHGNFRPLKL